MEACSIQTSETSLPAAKPKKKGTEKTKTDTVRIRYCKWRPMIFPAYAGVNLQEGFQICIYPQKAAPKSADKAFFGAVLCPEKAGISASFIINIQTKQEKGGRKLVKDNKNSLYERRKYDRQF